MFVTRRSVIMVAFAVGIVMLLYALFIINSQKNPNKLQSLTQQQWQSNGFVRNTFRPFATVTPNSNHKEPLSDLLLYKHNKTLRQFVKDLHSSGEMMRVVKTMPVRNPRLPEFYPNLDFKPDSFSSFDGKPLDKRQVVSRVLSLRSPKQPVPNVVHHFAISDRNRHYALPFPGYVSLLSSLWVSGADLVIVWLNKQPAGRYWQLFRKNVTQSGKQNRVIFGDKSLPDSVFGIKMNFLENKVDVVKLRIAILLGGILVDNDVITVRSLQPLRKHECVMGRDVSFGLCIGTMLSAPANRFITSWYMMYQSYLPNLYGHFGVYLPHQFQARHRSLCHVEENSMCRPNYNEPQMSMIFVDLPKLKKRWDWRSNYMVNIWRTLGRNYPGAHLELETVRSANTMYGEVARFVLFGNSTRMA